MGVVLIASVATASGCRYQPKIAPAEIVAAEVIRAPSTASPGGPRWRLFAVGDVKIDPDDIARDPFGAVRPALADADLSVVNVEMAIGDPTTAGAPATKSYTFLGSPMAPAILAKAGVTVASLANNHSLDYGPVALMSTIGRLRGAGVAPVGAGPDDAAAYQPVIRTVAGGTVRVAVVAGSAVYPESTWAAARARPGVASAYNAARFATAVRAARAQADVVIAFLHWGEESRICPNDAQRSLAAALRRAGATAVLGAHPHVLQPLVREGDGVVAYSLGNFVFDRRTGPAGESVVLELGFDGTRLVEVTTHPHVLDSGRPQPVSHTSAAGRRVAASLANPCAA
jgi:poly-gamma-glutamate synthesis protein (capsule biosynthesis protein)